MSAVDIGHKRKKWRGELANARELASTAGADDFEQLKQKLLREQLAAESDAETRRWLQHAADESAAVAWTTAYPLLVWPELLEEASRAVRIRAERQRRIRARNGRGLAA